MANKLQFERSAYLQQHKDNPIDWYPWSEEVFSLAKKNNKPVFLSIGYSSCYWCHVMEQDSFEDKEIAEFINTNFFSIKVDREERPDLDSIYMDVVTMINGHGGWPMSVFLTPEKKPFWGGTFFYKKDFLNILKKISSLWNENNQQVFSSAEEIYQYLTHENVSHDDARHDHSTSDLNNDELLNYITSELSRRFDPENGGFGKSPKFPPYLQLSFLLRRYKEKKESDNAITDNRISKSKMTHNTDEINNIHTMIDLTLKSMASGGMIDHIHGGFHRYSVDEKWNVPHFEKMLYDNALLASLYTEAALLLNQPVYKNIVETVIDFLLKFMADPKSGFYSSFDAGEVGKEGEYYVWDYQELAETLSKEELIKLTELFAINSQGNFEGGKNILRLRSAGELEKKLEIDIQNIIGKLKNIATNRMPPRLDKKIITAWNGLVMSALSKAGRAFNNQKYIHASEQLANFYKTCFSQHKELRRCYFNDKFYENACLEDYSFLIEGLIELHQATLKEEFIQFAVELQKLQNHLFWQDEQSGFYTTSSSDVLLKKIEYYDSATPSGNSVSLSNLLKLTYFDSNFLSIGLKLYDRYLNIFATQPLGCLKAISGFEYNYKGRMSVSINQNSKEKGMMMYLNSKFLPDYLATAIKNAPDEREQAVLCKNNSCNAPILTLSELKKTI